MHITVNVKGTLFQVKKEVLMESKYFRDLLVNHTEGVELYVNDHPFIFEHVINFLTIDNYQYPIDLTHALDHYGVEYEGVVKCASKKCSRKVDPKDVYCDFCKRGFIYI